MLICSVFYYNFIRSGIHAIFKGMQKQKRGKNETRKSMEKSNNYQSVEQGVGRRPSAHQKVLFPTPPDKDKSQRKC